jgi:hypothetical protein
VPSSLAKEKIRKPMKKNLALLVLCAGLVGTSGAIFDFDIGPLGLNGANERPAPVVTAATGGELASVPSMSLNTSTHELFVNYGWGIANGYTDLTSPFTFTHVHGPGDLNTAAPVLYDLTSLVTIQSSTVGGIFGKTLQLVTLSPGGAPYSVSQQEADLLNGLWYVNVHDNTHPDGEIRGQLISTVPEPRTYATLAGVSLLGFAAYRRFKARTA